MFCISKSGKHLFSRADLFLLIQTSWLSAGLIKCLAKLGPVLDESILAGKTGLTFAILEVLAKYGSFG